MTAFAPLLQAFFTEEGAARGRLILDAHRSPASIDPRGPEAIG